MPCQNCGHTWTGPGYDSDICPACGEKPMLHEMDASGPLPSGSGDPERFDMSGNPLMEGIWGSIDGGWQNRMKRDESFASVRTANDDDYGFGDDDDWDNPAEYSGYGEEDAAQHGVHSRFIVSDKGQVLHGPQPGSDEYHENIADAHGLSKLGPDGLPEFATGPYSLGVAHNDGTIDFPQHNSGHDLGTMTALLAQHYPNHTVDPNLQQTSNQQRWFGGGDPSQTSIPEFFNQQAPPSNPMNHLLEQQSMSPDQHQEMQQAEKGRGKPFGYYNNPWINRGGSVQDNSNSLYLPWNIDTAKIATDFDVVQVIPDGPHTVETEDGLVLQHEDPQKLDEAVERVVASLRREAIVPLLLAGGAMLGRMALTYAAKRGLQAGATKLAPRLLAGMTKGAIAKGAAKTIGRAALGQAAMGGIKGILGMGGGGQAGPAGGGAAPPAIMPAQYLSMHQELLSAFDHPSSDDNLTERASGDPEDVDSKEVNDGSHDEWQNDNETNDQGGSDAFTPEVMQALDKAAPKLIEYFDSEQSGDQDPDIHALIHALEQAHPGIFDQPDDDIDPIDFVDYLKSGEDKEPSAVGTTSDHVLGATPQQMAQQALQPSAPGNQIMQPAGPGPGVNPTTQASCPSCGARITPGSGVCPQCGGAANVMPQQNAVPPPIPAQVGVPGMQALTAGMYQGDPVSDPRQHDDQLQRLLANPNLTEQQRNALTVAMSLRHQNIEMGMARQRAQEYNTHPQAPAQSAPPLGPPNNTPAPFKRNYAANQGPHSVEQITAVVQFLQQNGQYTPGETEQQILADPSAFADILAQLAGRQQPPSPDPDPGVPPPMPDPSQMGMPPGAVPAGPGAAPPGMPMMGSHQAAADSITPQCPECSSHTTGLVSDAGGCQCSRCGHEWQIDTQMAQGSPKTSLTHQELHPDHPDVEGVAAADQVAQDDPEQDINPGAWSTNDGSPLRVGQQYEMYSAQYDVPDVVRISAIKPDSVEYILTGEYGLEHRTEITKQEADMDQLQFVPLGEDAQPESEQPAAQPAQPAFSNLRSYAAVTSGKKYTPMQQREFIDEAGEARNSDKLNLAGTHYEHQARLSEDDFLFGL